LKEINFFLTLFIHFLWRRENEPKETFTPPRPPLKGRMQKENRRNRRFSLGFGKPGHGLYFLTAVLA